MLPVVLPSDKLVFIEVFKRRAMISRYRLTQGEEQFNYDVERAVNWRELEPDAVATVKVLGGTLRQHNHYPCPDDLAARAIWTD